mgnify:CR=1 FL=1
MPVIDLKLLLLQRHSVWGLLTSQQEQLHVDGQTGVSPHIGLIKTGRLFSDCVREVNENLGLN